jgi:putative endonuclease
MRREHRYYVYIVQSASRRALYIGMTSNLTQRVHHHKTHECESFTDSYNAVRLVYWENFDDVIKAINREKQLKNWCRAKKLWLIARINPKFKDLSADWYKKSTLKTGEA